MHKQAYSTTVCNSLKLETSQLRASLVAWLVKNLPANTGDVDLSPGLGRFPGEGNGYPLQYSGLVNSMDCIVHGIAESDTTERLPLSPVEWMPTVWQIHTMKCYSKIIIVSLTKYG